MPSCIPSGNSVFERWKESVAQQLASLEDAETLARRPRFLARSMIKLASEFECLEAPRVVIDLDNVATMKEAV